MPRIGVFDPDATAPTTSAVGDSASTGTAGSAARRDHVHGREGFGASAAAVGTSSAGVATTPSRSDHVHATGAGAPSASAVGDTAAVGAGPAAAMTDHKHGREAFAAPAIVLGTAAAAGVATTPIRSDSTIVAFDITVPTTSAVGDAAAVGAAAVASRRDHVHGREGFGASAAAVGTSSAGVATTPSRSDHVHATGAGTPSTQAFGDAAAVGTGPAAAMTDHKHGMPAAPAIGGGMLVFTSSVTVPANQGTTNMFYSAPAGAASMAYLRCPRNGTARAIWAGLIDNAADAINVTAGTLTILIQKNSVTQTTLSITGAPQTNSLSWTFAAADYLNITYSTGAGFTPTTAYAAGFFGWEWD